MMVIRRFFVFVFLFVGILSSGFGQLLTIQTVLDTNKIEIGDRVELKYVLEKAKTDVIVFPEFGDTLILGVEVLEPPVIDSIKLKTDKVKVEQRLIITAFEEGMYYIPPQPFALKSNFGRDTVFSKASYLQVVGVAIDTTGVIRDISGVQRAPIIWRDFLPLIILLAIALITLLIVFIVRKWKRNKGLLPILEKPAEPAHIIALRELDKLKAQKLWQQQQLKEYYSRLTSIIRTYIENRYGILALEKPSSEILVEIRFMGLAKQINLTEFEGLLNLADMVKFAKGEANPEDNIEHLENAYSLVKATSVKEEDVVANEKTKLKG